MSSVIVARGENDHEGKFEEATFISFQYATDCDILFLSSAPCLQDTLIQFGSNAAGAPMIPLLMGSISVFHGYPSTYSSKKFSDRPIFRGLGT